MSRPYTEVRFKGTDAEIKEQWLEARKHGLGGSDASAVMGMNPYRTPLLVWMEKTGRMIPEDISDVPAVYWGSILEDVVAAEFAKRHPDWKVKRKNALLRSVEHPFMTASLDRVVTDEKSRRGILECKTAGAHRKADWDGGVPDYYLPQPIHYLAVTGFDFYAVAVLIGGQDYREYIYERDDEDIKLLIKCEGVFWQMVQDDVMPMPTASEDDADALLQMNPDPDGEMVAELDEDVPEIARYAEVSKRLKALKEEKSALGNILRQKIGKAKGIETPRLRITWTRSERERFDQKAFAADYPELFDKYKVKAPHDGGLRVKEVA